MKIRYFSEHSCNSLCLFEENDAKTLPRIGDTILIETDDGLLSYKVMEVFSFYVICGDEGNAIPIANEQNYEIFLEPYEIEIEQDEDY